MSFPVLTTAAEIDALIHTLEGQTVIGFDTEFHSERTYVPRLMLMQLSTPDAVYLVDPLGQGDMGALFRAMARPGLCVVGHALKNDLRIAAMQWDVAMTEVFDTQIAAAFLGHGLQVGLSGLLANLLGVHQPKGDQMSDWSQRPLPERMLGYAAGDVLHLLPLHQLLTAELQKLGRLEWVLQECRELCDLSRYTRDPDQAFARVAGGRRMDPREAGVLHALAAERERLAIEEDLVPHFLLPDDVLVLLAKAAPKQKRDLETDRRFGQRAVHRHAQRWLTAIAHGLLHPLKRPPSRPPPGPELEAVVALLMLLVNDIAAKSSLAPQLLVKRETLLTALRDVPESPEALAQAAELTGWRADLLIQPLWALLTRKTLASCVADETAGLKIAFVDAG